MWVKASYGVRQKCIKASSLGQKLIKASQWVDIHNAGVGKKCGLRLQMEWLDKKVGWELQ